ncbi:TRAFAC clade GTPase domain-containing protein [Tropicibacter naphthalenivorans]|uniref:Double-GTPase 2 domain-containing protein n=1 Tax=Tropicibacter naphthalenivorans TaxID=441103 RepID=A0A0P1GHI9_9RHOB|nr:hypothetical protein [Tropicibacter naphthalenivorans]CUH81424.1 hypothetical protein TRN7648_03461 [Tropicibacter naphthalenivorans]SMD00485.1 hypothetical protein SAMN04488093_109129 [Tropicibacter naphthalenivorans]
MTMEKCANETCFAPEIGCALGHTDISKCQIWNSSKVSEASEEITSGEMLLPWTGSAFGLADLGFVSGRGKPIVVAVIGPQNAGKTTLLAAWYLLLGRGLIGCGKRSFAGSFTLSGWEAVAGSLRWEPGQSPRFPAHTTSRSGRAPGLLHLRFRHENDDSPVDYLFTDAPGEWFQRWAVNANSDQGEGARWVSDNADAFIIVADREALAGEAKGAARGSLQRIVARLGAERGGRPVALAWTKSDVEISDQMETAVRSAVTGAMPDAVEHSVSVVDVSGGSPSMSTGTGLVELLLWAMSVKRSGIQLPTPVSASLDPLFICGSEKL